MADVTDITTISGSELTETIILGLRERWLLNVHNILANKWDAIDYAEFGSAGHRKDTSKFLAIAKAWVEFYTSLLGEVPEQQTTIWDDPGI